MLELFEQLHAAPDPRHAQALAVQLTREGATLEELAKRFEEQELAKAGPAPTGRVEIALTPGQRRRVKERTGVDLASIFLPDASGALTRNMPHADPAQIE